MSDNVTTISHVNNTGGMKSQTYNDIACRIWDFCTKNQLWVSTVHIPGTINNEADKQSRVLEDATEWRLNPALFHKIVEKFGKPDIINPILVPAVITDDQPGPIVFSAVTKKFGIATQTLCEPPAMQKTPVNSNQGNSTAKKI